MRPLTIEFNYGFSEEETRILINLLDQLKIELWEAYTEELREHLRARSKADADYRKELSETDIRF